MTKVVVLNVQDRVKLSMFAAFVDAFDVDVPCLFVVDQWLYVVLKVDDDARACLRCCVVDEPLFDALKADVALVLLLRRCADQRMLAKLK